MPQNLNPDSNLNSSEEVYLHLVHSYINATREILNGYMTFETGLTRAINSQIFRNFSRSSFTAPSASTSDSIRQTGSSSMTREHEVEPAIETPLHQRETVEIPDTPVRPTLQFRSNIQSSLSSSLSPLQVPTPVRLINRLGTPPTNRREEQDIREPRFALPRRVGGGDEQASSLLSNPVTANVNTQTSTSTSQPPFASTFVRYRLPVPIGPPRRVSAETTANTNETTNTTNTSTTTNVRRPLEIPIFSPVSSPEERSSTLTITPPPAAASQRRQQLRERRRLDSLSPILSVEPTPFPPASAPAPAPLSTATRLMLNLLDTPQMNDTLIYYTQIIDREIARSREGRTLGYDAIQEQTRIIPYCTITEPLNDICPISQVHFDMIDAVMQINICKHIFNPYSLLRWFDSNSTCPMCRRQINLDSEYNRDDEQTIHMYNNGNEEEHFHLTESNQTYENNYDSDDSS